MSRDPLSIRACHPCGARGLRDVYFDGAHVIDERLIAAWYVAHGHLHSSIECDGWHTVICPDCNGTGLVGIRETVKRWLRAAA